MGEGEGAVHIQRYRVIERWKRGRYRESVSVRESKIESGEGGETQSESKMKKQFNKESREALQTDQTRENRKILQES